MTQQLGSVFAIIIGCALIAAASASDVDERPPALVAASFSETTVEDNLGARNVTLHYEAAGKGAGLHAMTVRIRGTGEKARTYITNIEFNGEKSATGEIGLTIPGSAPAGEYEVSVSLSDRAGKVTPYIYGDEPLLVLVQGGSQAVDNSNPEIISLTPVSSQVDVSSGSNAVTFNYELSDVGSGLHSFQLRANHNSLWPKQYSSAVKSFSGQLNDNGQISITFPQSAPPGNYKISNQLIDKKGNFRNGHSIFQVTPAITIQVINTSGVDAAEPKIDALSATPNTFSVGSSGRTVTFDYEISDADSGLKYFRIQAQRKGGPTYYSNDIQLQGEKTASGQLQMSIPPGAAPGTYRLFPRLQDVSGIYRGTYYYYLYNDAVFTILANAVDNDGDGHTDDVDCNDDNPSIHPGAPDDTADYVDNDCDGVIDEDVPCAPHPDDLSFWMSPDPSPIDVISGQVGTAPGGTTEVVDRFGGKAIELALDSKLTMPNTPGMNVGLSDFTVSYWVKTSNAPNQGYGNFWVLEKPGAPGQRLLRIGNGLNRSAISFGPQATTGSDLSDERWHHIAFSLTRSNAQGGKIYYDGNLIRTFTTTGMSDPDSSADLRVGFSAHVYRRIFQLDELEFYQRALSAAEVAQLASSPRCAPSSIPLNTPPTADASIDVVTTLETPVTFEPQQESNAEDNDGDNLTFSASAPANGEIDIDGVELTYTPNAGYTGDDSFVVTISDGRGGEVDVTVNVTIEAPPPVDNDGDGHTDDVDCNDDNPNIHPGALDHIVDGVDNDCDGQVDEDIAACKAPPAGMSFWLSPNPGPLDRITGMTGVSSGVSGTTAGPHGGGALSFGPADNLYFLTSSATNIGVGDFTIDFWIKGPEHFGHNGVVPIVYKLRRAGPGANAGYVIFADAGRIGIEIDGDPSGIKKFTSATRVDTGVWRHVAIAVDRDDASGGKIYVDGVLTGDFNPTNVQASLENTRSFWIGQTPGGQAQAGEFEIDELEIFQRALTAQEIADLYVAPKCGAGEPPTNAPPTAVDDAATVVEGETVIIPAADNDTDPDAGDLLTVTSAYSANGQATVNSDGNVSFTANVGYTGPVGVQYYVSDAAGAVAKGSIVVTVTPAPVDNDNDGHTDDVDCDDTNPDIYPGAPDDTLNGLDNDCDTQVDEHYVWPLPNCRDQRHDFEFSHVFADISNIDTVCVCAANATGCNAISTQGCLNSEGFPADKLPRIVDLPDGSGQVCVYSKGSASHPRTGSPGAYWAQRITNPDLDHDGHTDDVDCDDNNANIHPGAPDDTSDGLDNDCDGEIDEDVNNAPIADDINLTINENETLTVDVLADGHASDPDGDALTLTIATQPQTGSASANGSVITFVPLANSTATKSFKYTVTDPKGASATAWVHVQINPVYDAPDFSVTKTLQSCQSFGPGAASCVYKILIENNGGPYQGEIQIEDLTNQKVNQFTVFDVNSNPLSCQAHTNSNPSPLTFSAGPVISGRYDVCTIPNASIDSSTPIELTAMMKLGGPAQWPPSPPLNCAVVIMWDGRPSAMATEDFPSSCIDALTVPLVDADGDGHMGDVDCDDNDPAIHPGAPDDTADGIDNDCDGEFDEDIVACPDATDKGMSWGKISTHDPSGAIRVGCNGICDPYNGDTLCSTKLALLCFKPGNEPRPASLPESTGQYHKWSGGTVAATAPLAACTFDRLSDANARCAAEFGAGWRVADYHDGVGHSFWAYGEAPDAPGRFWSDISDQPGGACWRR